MPKVKQLQLITTTITDLKLNVELATTCLCYEGDSQISRRLFDELKATWDSNYSMRTKISEASAGNLLVTTTSAFLTSRTLEE